MKKITVLVAMLAVALFAAVPAFAQIDGLSIEVEEGSVEITETLTVTDSIVQSCEASVVYGDGNANAQEVANSQTTNSSVSQSISQSGFSPSAGTSCTQEIVQAAVAG